VVREVADVLERVVSKFTAVGLVSTHQETKAVEIGNLKSLLRVLTLEQLVEGFVNVQSVGDFIVKFGAGLFGLILEISVVEVVKLDITRVNDVLGLRSFIIGFHNGLNLVLSFLEEAVNVVALESADEFALEALVTELLNW